MTITHSIIIPTHNRPEGLVRAVASAIVEAGETGEVIVVDDASDRPAEDVLRDVSFERLRHLRSPTPMAGGGSPARNMGAREARGEFLFFLDDDDEFLPGYCASILNEGARAEADFGFSAREFAEASDRDAPKITTETRGMATGVIPWQIEFPEKTFPFSAGFWLTKAGYAEVGPMEHGLRTNSDTEYACRLYSSSLRGWYSAEPGVRIYEHVAQSATETRNVTKRTRSADRANAFAAIAARHADFLKRDKSAGRFVYTRLAKHAARAGQRTEALAAIRKIEPWTAGLKACLLTLPSMIRTGGGD